MKQDILDHHFIKQWRDTQMIVLSKMYPQLSEDELLNILHEQIKLKCVDANATLHNNHENKTIKTTLLNVVDWIEDTKPILAGFGTFFSNQDQKDNPLARLIDLFLVQRKKYKGQLKVYKRTDPLYSMFDRRQLTEKISANSIYGGLGCPSFKCYNLYTASAITGTGQQLISTARGCFEAFMTNTDKFSDLNECIQFIVFTCQEKHNFNWKTVEEVSVEKLYERLSKHFEDFKSEYRGPLLSMIRGLTKEERTRCYYKNNLYDFINCKTPHNILKDILRVMNTQEGIKNPKVSYTIDSKSKGDAWEFISCDDIPLNIKDNLNQLKELMIEFVYSDIILYDRIHKNKTNIRKTITAQDTDSVMPCVYQWCMYCRKVELENGYGVGINEQLMHIGAANTMAFILKAVIDKSMYLYTTRSKIPERYKKRINMKNEFLFSRQVLAETKKRYLSEQLVREGTVLDPPKLDPKGFDFMKSTTTEETKEEFMEIIREYIFNKENSDIDVAKVIEAVKKMENDIVSSLRSGEKKHLTPAKVNPGASYKFPLRNMGFRAVIAWNIAYPHKEIQLPDDIDIVKLKINTIEDIEFIKDYDMNVYQNIYKGIFHNPNDEIVSKGIQVIAIPRNEPVPEWVKCAIDVDTISGNTLSKFYPVLSSLGAKIHGKKSANSKVYYSNLIDF